MLLERDRELAALRTLVAAAGRGDAGLAVVEGPAGIGKTRLLTEARREAGAAGVRVLAARGGELERELAFGIVRQLFEAIVSEPLLEGGAAAAREVFQGPASGVADDDASFAILHALYRLTVTLAEPAPLLLAVDDLQWCDEPSLRWLNYLVRRLDGLSVTVLCGVRPFERHRHAHLLAELSRDPLAVMLHPMPLSMAATGELLGDDADAVFTQACHVATGGNPLLLVELDRALRAEEVPPDAAHVAKVDAIAPRAVSRAVLVRIGRLSRDASAVARATAVLGDVAALPLVADLAHLDDAAAVTAAGALIEAEVFADRSAMAFVHPLIRAAVYEDTPVHERSLAHERAARLLYERGADAGTVATQLVHAPPRNEAWVADVLEHAARAAQRAGALMSALSYLTRALAESPSGDRRARVLASLGNVENQLYEKRSEEHLREALELTDDPVARGTIAVVAGLHAADDRPPRGGGRAGPRHGSRGSARGRRPARVAGGTADDRGAVRRPRA